MKLSSYMKLKALTDQKLADQIGRNRSNVTRWRLGNTRPDWEALASLERVTEGAVTAKDFMQNKKDAS